MFRFYSNVSLNSKKQSQSFLKWKMKRNNKVIDVCAIMWWDERVHTALWDYVVHEYKGSACLGDGLLVAMQLQQIQQEEEKKKGNIQMFILNFAIEN